MPDAAEAVRTPTNDAPFRAELLGPDRLAEAARQIARGQSVTREPGPKTTPLLELTATAAEGLALDHADLNEIAQRRRIIAPAGEWLLDNYYLIEHQIIEIREDLPPNYGVELPRLVEGSQFGGLPRIYELAVGLIAHSDSRLERDPLLIFVQAYQEVSPLTIGECWAVPIMLRVALVENLRRLSGVVVRSHRRRGGR